MSQFDLSIVIVSHNHAAYLQTCLASLAPGRHGVSTEVFVVANLPADGTAVLVQREFPTVRLLQNRRPQGFAANNNQALRLSQGRCQLLLNPDTEVPPGMLERLLAFVEAQPQIGICGPQLRFPDGALQPSCRRFPTLSSVIARRSPLRRWLWNSQLNERHLMADFDHTQTGQVDWLLGAALLTRREFLQTVGLMDAGYFLYVEDIDWAYRARQAGWQVVYYPETKIIHHHLAQSDRVLLSQASWWHLQSMWRYYRKHLAPAWLRLSGVPERLP